MHATCSILQEFFLDFVDADQKRFSVWVRVIPSENLGLTRYLCKTIEENNFQHF